jgi:hypothetical protein
MLDKFLTGGNVKVNGEIAGRRAHFENPEWMINFLILFFFYVLVFDIT